MQLFLRTLAAVMVSFLSGGVDVVADA
jgi:hypothetical protein